MSGRQLDEDPVWQRLPLTRPALRERRRKQILPTELDSGTQPSPDVTNTAVPITPEPPFGAARDSRA
jgi:hypothetical protein